MRNVTVRINLERLLTSPQRIRGTVQRVLRSEIGPDLLSECVRNAPVDEGTLRGSHSLHVAGERTMTGSQFGGDASGTPADGGVGTGPTSLAVVANSVYAMYQHETIELNHPKGGEAKWAERALERNRAAYVKRLGEAAMGGI